MKIRSVFIVGFILALGLFAAVAFFLSVNAQMNNSEEVTYGAKMLNFPNVSVAGIGENKIGFFDSLDGKLYIYDVNLNRCEKILQVQSLGSPLLELRKY